MNTITDSSLFANWHLMRWIALVVGLFFVLQAFRYADWISGFLGAFFLFQAYTNSGCIVGACDTTQDSESQSDTNEIEFTEIKES